MNINRPEIVDGDTPRGWPNPGWPGCPGPGRQRLAQNAYQATGGYPAHPTDLLKMKPMDRKAALDAEIIREMEETYQQVQEFNQELTGWSRHPNFGELFAFTAGLASRDVIGLLVVPEPTDDAVCTTTAAMSRHHRWMGRCTALATIPGLTSLVYCYDHTPTIVVAIPPQDVDPYLTQIRTCLRGAQVTRGRNARTLEKILRFHQSEPRFIDLCTPEKILTAQSQIQMGEILLRTQNDENETPTPPHMHNGNPNDWRN